MLEQLISSNDSECFSMLSAGVRYFLDHCQFPFVHDIIRISHGNTKITRANNCRVNTIDAEDLIYIFDTFDSLDLCDRHCTMIHLFHAMFMISAWTKIRMRSTRIASDPLRRIFTPAHKLLCLLFCLHHRYHNSAGSTVQNSRHVSPRKLCHSYNRRKTSSISKQDQVCQLVVRKRTMFAVIKDKIHSSLLCNQRHSRTVHRLDKHTF